MDEGLLWFDNDPKSAIEDKVRRALGRFQEKFGRDATICYLNPGALAGRTDADSPREVVFGRRKVKIVAAHNILPHHFWVGVAPE